MVDKIMLFVTFVCIVIMLYRTRKPEKLYDGCDVD